MAPRSFEASDLVALPRLSAAEVLALVAALESAAKQAPKDTDTKLPEPTAEALADLKAARSRLREVRARRRVKARVVDPARAREADLTLDRAWGALQGWSSAWSLVSPEFVPRQDELQQMHEQLFGDGMGFLNLKYKAEWGESETRLEQIKRQGHDKLIVAHGGSPLLDALRAAHQAYGSAIGVTSVVEETAPEATGDEAQQAFVSALEAVRHYVLEAAVLAKRKDASLRALSSALLRPLSSWESSTRPREEDEPEAPVAPAGPGQGNG